MKRLIVLFLAIVMALSLVPTAFAASDEAENAAKTLYSLGLFKGTGTDTNGNPIFDLDRAPTRHEAITMLVRLLGKETEATVIPWSTPFTDVANWAKPYVGYAYTSGLTNGISATEFGGNQTVTLTQYLTFVLRALGYESGIDFEWNKAWVLSDQLGITNGQYNETTMTFTRGDAAIISLAALTAKLKGEDKTLIEKLTTGNVVSTKAAMEAGLLSNFKLNFTKTPAVITYASISENGSTRTSKTVVEAIRYTLAPNYSLLGKFEGYDLTLNLTVSCGLTEFAGGGYNLFFVIYDNNGKVVNTETYHLDGARYGMTYMPTITFRKTLPAEGEYTILLRSYVWDSRTGQGTYYDVY